MKIQMNYETADALMRFAKGYTDPKTPQRPMTYLIRATVENGKMTACMVDSYKGAQIELPVYPDSENGTCYLAPVKGFTKKDSFVEITAEGKETVYRAATGSVSAKMPDGIADFDLRKALPTKDSLAHVTIDPQRLIDALLPYAKTGQRVRLDLHGELQALTMTTECAKSLLLPCRPADNVNYYNPLV